MDVYSPPRNDSPRFAIAEKALRRWATERLQRGARPGGGTIYTFSLSGSTCTNMGLPIEALMIVEVNERGTIESATVGPAKGDSGWAAMCGVGRNAAAFLAEAGACAEAIGLSVREAATREWNVETSGCFCTVGNRRHKWRNAFQTILYAETHALI